MISKEAMCERKTLLLKHLKRCSICKEILDLYEFNTSKKDKSGFTSECKQCRNRYKREIANPKSREQRSAYLKIYRQKPDVQQKKRQWDSNKNIRKYGITLAKYDEMVLAQEGRCPICEEPCQEFHIDHDHVTNVVRGLLCNNCNGGLGRFKDSTRAMRRAADYLENLL